MNKILYIIGAGASANVLPTINNIIIEGRIQRKGLASSLIEFTQLIEPLSEFANYISLCNEATNFTTPDTFAKFLYSTNRDNDYVDFKRIISCYFFWKEWIDEGSQNKCLDKRVISFISTLADNGGNFSKDVKIISWNYDSQFVKAIKKARETVLNNSFVPNFKNYPLIEDSTIDKINLTLLHLNGIAGYSYDTKSAKKVDKFINENIEQIMKLDLNHLNRYDKASVIKKIFELFSNDNENLMISFAWEKEFESNRDYCFANSKLEYARALARGTDILVVIGYSFPYFNREVDKEIFAEMPTLKKIYFQDPQLDGQYLYNQFNLINDKVKVEHIKDVNNYFVPYEL